MKRNVGTIIIGIAIIIAAFVLGKAYSSKYHQQDVIAVTGSGSEDFTSDLIVWKASFSVSDLDLKTAYEQLESDRSKVRDYLSSKGIKSNQAVFSSVDIQKNFDYQYDKEGNQTGKIFRGYTLTQSFKIESKEVDKLEQVSRESTELINKGIELIAEAPEYYYTKLSELKLKMIESATKDAYERAQTIAKNSGGKLGRLKSSSMGVIQINARNSNDEYSWGGNFNTSSKLKTASITIRLQYVVR